LKKRKSKLDTPHIKEEVVKRLAAGESQSSIARRVGLDQSQISRFANKAEIKPFVEEEQMRLLESVPDAVQNIKDLVSEMSSIPKAETKRRELSYKASKELLRSAGILPTPVGSQTLVNIYKDNRQQVISPRVLKIGGRYINGEEDKED
jgi:hypothetical protein